MTKAAMKKDTFALVKGFGWFVVDKVGGDKSYGKPWFIGIGQGFDISRLLVFASNESDAEEIAEERWPHLMGTRIPKREEDESEESGRSTFFSKNALWYSVEDVRIFKVASRVERGVPDQAGRKATLSTGEVVEYT